MFSFYFSEINCGTIHIPKSWKLSFLVGHFEKASYDPKLLLHIDSLLQKNKFLYALNQCAHFEKAFCFLNLLDSFVKRIFVSL